MNKKTLLSLMMLLIAVTGIMRAQELTVHDGTTTSSYVPFYGFWVDDYTRSEMIYPAAELADMIGTNINSLTFYKNSTTTTSWGTASFQVYLKEVSNTALSAYIGMTDATIVYEGGIDAVGGEIQVTINFTTPYYYNGGNLLVGIYQTVTGSYSSAYWYGENVSDASANGYDSSSPANATFNQRNFLPKTTFTYDSCQVPTGLTVTNTTATSATLSWTENGDSESWLIYYRHDSPSPVPLPYDTVSASVNPFTLTGLVTNAHYEAFVVPTCGVGTQDFYQFASNTVDFTPADFYNITVSANLPNAGTVTGGGEYSFGDTCTLTATPNIGYYFYSWMQDGVMIGNYYQDEYTFTVTESANIVAYFQQIEYFPFITSMPRGAGWGEVVGLDYATSGAIHYGDTVTIRAIPNEDFRFYKWTMWDGTGNDDYGYIDLSTDTLYTFTFDENFVGFYAGNQGEIEFVANFIESIGDCVRPLDLTATEVGPTSAILSWTELGTSQAWMMYYRPAYTAAYVPYDSLEIYQNPYTLMGLQPNTSYEAYIIPSCGITDGIANEYLASNTVTFTTLEACPTPMSVEVTDITGTSATVSWVGYSDSYQVQLGHPDFAIGTYFENGIPSDWANSTDYPWIIVDGHMQSGNEGVPNSTSSISVTVTFPADGAIEFDAECMGEGDGASGYCYDHCDLYIDNTRVLYAGNEFEGWNHYSYNVTAGEHTFTWSYTKDQSINNPGDHFAVDNVIMHTGEIDWDNPIPVGNAPYTITGMDPTSNYCVRVKGINADTESGWSNPVFFTTAEVETFTITVTANPAAGGNVSGGGTYMQGASCTLTATANTGYTFTGWSDGVTTNPRTVTVTEPATYVANFELQSFNITVSADPTEGGTVSGGGTYNYGTSVTLTATPAAGYAFINWTKNGSVVSTNATYTFNVTEGGNYVAHFSQNSYTLTVNYKYADGSTAAASHTESVNYGASYSVTSPTITGYTPDLAVVTGTMGTENVTVDVTYSINSYNISASANPTVGGSVNGAGTYNHFETAILTATASMGYTFINWTENGTVVSTSPTISFMVEGPRTLVANFQLNSYQITAIANPTVGGTATGTGTYNHFETCTLVATPNEYYVFTNWTKNGQVVSVDATYSFTVEGGGTYVAHFTRVNHQITALANPTEGGSVSGTGSYEHGSYCTLTATANTGYTFFNWTKNGQVVSSNPSYSFSVTEDATYVANFNLNNYTITVSADPTVGGMVSGGGAYLFGSNCTISAMANAGYTFTNWTKNGTVVSTDATYTFQVTDNANLVAHFSLDHYNITVSVDPEAGGTATGGGSFTYGETCNLSATPNTGYAFVNWTKNGSVVSNNASYSFTVTDNGDYVAHFAVARYTITVLAMPAESGSVHGAGTYDYGHVVTLRAIAHEGYEFINWTKDGAVVSSNANYSIVVRENAEYVANFRPYVYEIKANTNPDNTGDLVGVGLYNYGETCTLTVTPHAEYEFVNWTLNGEVVSEEESFSFIVTEAREYVAHLEYVEGIDEQSNLSVTLYPNPAKFKLNIEASEPIKMLEIYTIDGALVSKQDYSSDKIMINVDTFASGTYMIRLTTDSAVEIRRFVKE